LPPAAIAEAKLAAVPLPDVMPPSTPASARRRAASALAAGNAALSEVK
jgi:hypothetical protein